MKKFLTHLSLISLFLISSCSVLNGTENKDIISSLKEKSEIVFTKNNLIQIKDSAGICVLVKELYKNTFNKYNNRHMRPFDVKIVFEKKVSVNDRELYFSPLYFAMQDFLNGINNTDTEVLEAAKRIYSYDHELYTQERTLILLNSFIYDATFKLREKFISINKTGSEYNNLMFRVLLSLYNNGFNQDGSIKDLLLLKIANYLLIMNNYVLEKLQKEYSNNNKDNEEYINKCFNLPGFILPLKINISTLTGRTRDKTTIKNLKEDLDIFLSVLNTNTKEKTEERNSEVANINFQYNNNLNTMMTDPQFNKTYPNGFIEAIVNQQYPLKWDKDTFKATVDGIQIDLGQLENPEALKAAFYEKEFIKIVKLLNNAAQQNPDEYGDFTRIADLIKNDVLQIPDAIFNDIFTQTAQPSAQPAQVNPATTASTTVVVPARRTLAPLRKPAAAAKQQTAEPATTIPVIQNLPPAMLPQPQTSTFNKKDYFYNEDNKINNQKINDDLIQALLWNNQYPIKMNNPTLVADIIKMLYEKNNNDIVPKPENFSYETTITTFDKNQYSQFLKIEDTNKLNEINYKIVSIMTDLMNDIKNTLQDNSKKFLTNAYAHKAMRIIIALYVNGFDQSGNVKDLLSIKLANYIMLYLKHKTDYVKFEKLLSSLSTALKDSYQDEKDQSLEKRIRDLIFNLNQQAAGTSTREWLANPTFKHQDILDKKSNCEEFAEEIIKKQNSLRWDQDTFKATVNGVTIDLGQLENPEIIKADFYKKEFIKIAQWLHNAAQQDANEYGNFERIASLIINDLLQMPANTLTKIAATNAQPAILASQKQETKASTSPHHDRQIFAQDYPKQTVPTAVVSSKPAAAALQPIVDTDDRRVKGKQAAAYDDDRDEEVIVTKTADTKQQLPSAPVKKERKPIVIYRGDEVFNLPPVNTQPSKSVQQTLETEKISAAQQQATPANIDNAPKKVGPTVLPKPQAQPIVLPAAAPIAPEIKAQPAQPIVLPVPAAPIRPEINAQPAQPAGIVERLWQGTKNVAQTVGNLLTEESSSSDEEDNGFGLLNELINKDRQHNNDYFNNNNILNKYLVDFESAENIIVIARTACHAVASSNNYNKLFSGTIIRSLITLASCYKTNQNPATAQLITTLISHPHTQNIQKQDCPAGSVSKLAAQAPPQSNQAELHDIITNFTNARK